MKESSVAGHQTASFRASKPTSDLAEQDVFCMKYPEIKKCYQEVELGTALCHLPACMRYSKTSDTQQSQLVSLTKIF